MLNTTLMSNGGFETPAIAANSYQLNPTGGSPWTFSGTSGISRNTSSLMGTSAPAGTQVGLVQNTGKISQPLTLTAGSYSFKITAAQASGNTSSQTLQATIQSTTMVVTSTKQFIWNGSSIVEERDANNSVLRRFYPQGEQISGLNYCYMKDHLGSIVELNDSTGALKAEYAYDWWGNRTKRSGALDSEFGYTGFYYHQPSSLNLALYRAYDAGTMRWISRDPIAERGGVNLYAYVANRPIGLLDPLGLDAIVLFDTNAVNLPVLGPQGHVATLVGSDRYGWTYYSRNGYSHVDPNGDNVLRVFDSLDAFRNSGLADRYNVAYRVITTYDEDVAMATYGDANLREPYHTRVPPSNNCADLTEEILAAGGHPIPGDSTYHPAPSIEVPNKLLDNLRRSGLGHVISPWP